VSSRRTVITPPTDLQKALKLEPNNEAVKAELVRVDELILSRKRGKTVRPSILAFPRFVLERRKKCPAHYHVSQQSTPVEVSIPLVPASSPSPSTTTTTVPRKRRPIPITIVDDDTPQPPPSISPNAPRPTDTLLSPISSRVLSPSTPPPPDGKPTPTAAAPPVPAPAPALTPATQKPTPASFRDAKQARDAKSAGRIGGGIFRMSGNDTVFKTREVPLPAVADPPHDPAPAPAAPLTLFEFTRAWDRIPPADTATRWALLNVRGHRSLFLIVLTLSTRLPRRRSILPPSRRSSAPRSNPPSSPRSSPC